MELARMISLLGKNRTQTYYILGAIILLAVLFLGFDTKPSTQKAFEKSRSLNTQEFDIESLQAQGKQNLSKDELNYIQTLESQLQFAGSDTNSVRLLKEISGHWFKLGNPLLAGYYAKKVAEQVQDAISWSITGTTFISALSNAEVEEKNKLIAKEQAIEAFENAISLEPNIIEHRINQALCYIEVPDPSQPMKGIQMLALLAGKLETGRWMSAQRPSKRRGNSAASLSSGGITTPLRSNSRKSFVIASETSGPLVE